MNTYITQAEQNERTIISALEKTLQITFTGEPNTSWCAIAENVYADFLAYAADESSDFLMEKITDINGELLIDKTIEELDEFITFRLRENDLNDYDYT
jgi:hypothetical protein